MKCQKLNKQILEKLYIKQNPEQHLHFIKDVTISLL